MSESAVHGSSQALVGTREFRSLERLRALARLLDSAVQVPGTSIRFGLDPLIGLVPGIGDAIGAICSMVIIYHSARLGASRATLIRMMGNVGIDTLIGEIPFLGDLFDVGWKSNTRNLALLEQHLQRPAAARAGSQRVVLLTGAGLLLLLVGVVALGVVVAHFLLELVK